MISLTDIHSLTAFKRETARFLKQTQKTGQPLVLTVNGKAAVVVQDAVSYQRLMEAVERAQAVAGIRTGLDAFARGEGRSARTALRALRRKHDIPD